MRQTWIAVVVLACGGVAPAAIWNGEPSEDLAGLIKAADAGDQGARVELAWHAYEYHGVYRDLDRIRDLLTPAHRAGDPLATAGLAFLASAEKDFSKAHDLSRQGAATGHPQGKAALGMLLTGVFTPKEIRNPEKGMVLLEEAIKGGSIAATCFRAGYLMYDKSTPLARRRELAAEISALPPEMNRVALWIARWGKSSLGIGDEPLVAVLPTLLVADRCGHPAAGFHAGELERRLSRDELAVPHYIAAVNADHLNYGGFAKGHLYTIGYVRADVGRPMVRMNWRDWGDVLAADAIQTAVTHSSFVQRGAYTIAAGHDGGLPDPEKAIGILRKMAKTGDGTCNCHNFLAVLYSTEIRGCSNDYLDLELAAAHFIVHSHHEGWDWSPLHRILVSPWYPGGPRLPEAWAAALRTRETGPTDVSSTKVSTAQMLRLRARMTPAQIAEGERLFREGFPGAPKFREAAADILRERGEAVHPRAWSASH